MGLNIFVIANLSYIDTEQKFLRWGWAPCGRLQAEVIFVWNDVDRTQGTKKAQYMEPSIQSARLEVCKLCNAL